MRHNPTTNLDQIEALTVSMISNLLHLLPPETAHNAAHIALKSGIARPLWPAKPNPKHAVTLPVSGLTLPNPIGLAAGFDKNAEVFGPMLRYGFGFVECGTVTPRPQAGNPKPRLFRLSEDKAIINRMGFNNKGLDAFAQRLKNRKNDGIIGANVGANKDSEDFIADYILGLEAVWPHADYITLNVSSPNTPGLRGLQGKDALAALLERTGQAALTLQETHGRRPVFLKLAPDLNTVEIDEICAEVERARYLHGLIISNTTIARPESLQSQHAGEMGGLSGAPLLEASTKILGTFARRFAGKYDLIGVGGIATAADVKAKLEAGAHAVQIYSNLIYKGPDLAAKLLKQLA